MPVGIYQHKKGYKRLPFSDETKRKMSIAHIGKKFSEETKKKIKQNNAHYWKGKPSNMLGKSHSEETKKKISKGNKGKISPFYGKKHSEISKRKISNSYNGWNNKEKCNFWKGGITLINQQIRNSKEYKLWRKAVFERDNYTCIWCKQKGGKIEADHILKFALFPELRFAIDNGRTLCKNCHMKTETYLNKH